LLNPSQIIGRAAVSNQPTSTTKTEQQLFEDTIEQARAALAKAINRPVDVALNKDHPSKVLFHCHGIARNGSNLVVFVDKNSVYGKPETAHGLASKAALLLIGDGSAQSGFWAIRWETFSTKKAGPVNLEEPVVKKRKPVAKKTSNRK
jgi:hypothetical protein